MKYEKEQLETIVKISLSIADVCRYLGIRPLGGNYKTINKYIKKYHIDKSHFTGQAWNQGDRFVNFTKTFTLEEIMVEKSTYTNTNKLKERMLNEGIMDYHCVECGLTKWLDKDISLHLDHINGDNMDNRIENLRLLCPNCHSQTDTYCGKCRSVSKKNEIRKKKYKKIKEKDKQHYSLIKEKYYCSCGKEISKRAKQCEDCWQIKQRKVERPEKEILIIDVKELGYSATGRKYGVCDNTIRKWIIYYSNNVD